MPARYLIAALVALLCAACFGLAAGDQSPWLQFAATVAGILLLGAIASRAIAGLASRGAKVLRVPLYRWALPEDTRPLRDAASRLAGGSVDFLLFTSSRQVDHVMEIAAELGLASASSPPRPNTKGSPPLSRTTRRPARA